LEANGLSFNLIDEGAGPAVLLLHGFPDSSSLWRNQIPALVEAGFRAIAPDLRGFGESDKPHNVDQYSLPLILQDVAAILRALDVERVSLVGHDWGAVVAWLFSAFNPERVERLVAISVGHPSAFAGRTHEQMEKSWYMLLFQFEGVAEEFIRRNDWRFMRTWAAGGDVDRYVKDLSRPGALTAGLNWYRANIAPQTLLADPLPIPAIASPTLGIWSSDDMALTETQMRDSSAFVSGDWRYERIDRTGHWIPIEAPDRLNALLIEFLAPIPRSGA
jgi:pimeloyl-ACP methyl ester carboxylesterase